MSWGVNSTVPPDLLDIQASNIHPRIQYFDVPHAPEIEVIFKVLVQQLQ
jgi:hypothetical protein